MLFNQRSLVVGVGAMPRHTSGPEGCLGLNCDPAVCDNAKAWSEPEFPNRYTVPLQTILAGMGLTDTVLEENDVFVLTLHGGNGSYKLTHDGGGGSQMMYTYHPNEGLCEGDGICEWCGRTLW